MPSAPTELESLSKDLLRECRGIEGHLSKREISFLALLGACPTACGAILEIGSFKGRSTIVLAKSSALAGDDKVYAVDPLTSPSVTDPDLGSAVSAFEDFEANLARAKVKDRVQFYQMLSRELATEWSQPLRLLWIDGDHTYAGAKADFDLFQPYLVNRAIVALHDVLHAFDGPIRVFREEILASPHFGPCGICGSIGWGQFHLHPAHTDAFREENKRLQVALERLLPFASGGATLRGLAKLRFKLERARIPHGAVKPKTWLTRTILTPHGK